MGSRASSRSMAIRLIGACPELDSGLTPRRCRPITTPSSCAVGTRRRRHTGQVLAMQTCSATCTGTTGTAMTSRVRCVHPPDRWVAQSGQFSTTCSTRWVGVIRGRAKPWRRCLLGCCCAGGWRPKLDLRPGIRGGPSGFAWPSSSAIRRSNRSITRCCSRTVACSWALMAMRKSRSAVIRSHSVSTPSISHNDCHPRQRSETRIRPMHLTKSEQLRGRLSR